MIMFRSTPDIAVIGAGPAGLACADRLLEHGLQVQIFDKGRQPGGRVASRERLGFRFEHGAPGLRPVVDRLASRTPINMRATVTRIERDGDKWRLFCDDLPLRARFGLVILAVPAPQAAALVPDLAPMLRRVVMRPILAALVGLQGKLTHAPDVVTAPTGALAAAYRQRPILDDGDGAEDREAWVLHATDTFSQDNVDCDPDAVAQHLWQCLRGTLGLAQIAPLYLRGHRWRYGRTVSPFGQISWYDDRRRLGLCGDWCLGDSVDAALTSGRALAADILGLSERVDGRLLIAREGIA